MKSLLIDYKVRENNAVHFIRQTIDNYEFCVRDNTAYFISEGNYYQVPLTDISQVYTN